MLEVHCRNTRQFPVSISVISAEHRVLQFPSWATIVSVIKKTLSAVDNVQNVDEIINILTEKISTVSVEDEKILQLLRDALDFHNDPMSDKKHLKNRFPGTIHCEVVLAAMALYPHFAIKLEGDSDVDKQLKAIAEVIVPHSFSKSHQSPDPILRQYA